MTGEKWLQVYTQREMYAKCQDIVTQMPRRRIWIGHFKQVVWARLVQRLIWATIICGGWRTAVFAEARLPGRSGIKAVLRGPIGGGYSPIPGVTTVDSCARWQNSSIARVIAEMFLVGDGCGRFTIAGFRTQYVYAICSHLPKDASASSPMQNPPQIPD